VLAAIFGVGLFLCIAGIMRMYYTHRSFYKTYDFAWAAWDGWIWTVVEAQVAIICASATSLKTFTKRCLDKVSSISWSRTGNRRGKVVCTYTGKNGLAFGAMPADAKLHQRRMIIGLSEIRMTRSVDVDSRVLSIVEE
jgi:hypothetical protein